MKLLHMLSAVAALGVCAAPAAAHTHHHHHYSRQHRHHLISASAYGGGYYTAVSGHRVHRPVAGHNRPSDATAQCGDRTWSFSEHHRGTCSHHGGAARWL